DRARREHGGLPGAVGADHREELTRCQGAVHAVQRGAFVDGAGEEGLADVDEVEHPHVPPAGVPAAWERRKERSVRTRRNTLHRGRMRARMTMTADISFMSLASSPHVRASWMAIR